MLLTQKASATLPRASLFLRKAHASDGATSLALVKIIFFGSSACRWQARNGEKDLTLRPKDSVAPTVAALNVRRQRSENWRVAGFKGFVLQTLGKSTYQP